MAARKPYNNPDRINLNQIGRSGTIAILTNPGFRVSQMQEISHRLEKKGFRTVLASPQPSILSGRLDSGEEMNFPVSQSPEDISAKEIDGLVLIEGGEHATSLKDQQGVRLLAHDVVSADKPALALGLAATVLNDEDLSPDPNQATIVVHQKTYTGMDENAVETALGAFIKDLTTEPVAA